MAVAPTPVAPPPMPAEIQPGKLLLLEDEADIRGLLIEALRVRGGVAAGPHDVAGLDTLRALLAGQGVDMLVADLGLAADLGPRPNARLTNGIECGRPANSSGTIDTPTR